MAEKLASIKKKGGGDKVPTMEYVSFSISANQNIVIPTTQKAIGFTITSEVYDVFSGTIDDTYAYRDGSVSTNYSLTFTDNNISLGHHYSTARAYAFKGTVIYE